MLHDHVALPWVDALETLPFKAIVAHRMIVSQVVRQITKVLCMDVQKEPSGGEMQTMRMCAAL